MVIIHHIFTTIRYNVHTIVPLYYYFYLLINYAQISTKDCKMITVIAIPWVLKHLLKCSPRLKHSIIFIKKKKNLTLAYIGQF